MNADDRRSVGRLEAIDREFPESDWKVFCKLREIALERFCKRVLDQTESFREQSSESNHKRYLALYQWIGEQDEELARAFNDPRRSRMLWQLTSIHRLNLLETSELERFTPTTRETTAPPRSCAFSPQLEVIASTRRSPTRTSSARAPGSIGSMPTTCRSVAAPLPFYAPPDV